MAKMTFEEWMKKVDHLVMAKTGLSYHDLPDLNYHDLYDAGETPWKAAQKALAEFKECCGA